jgi:two-component system CAI-1 autoinducer sensor kinase/phosphatase CqsS
MKAIRTLFEHYTKYHEHGPLMLRYAGYLSVIGFPAFYVLRHLTNPAASYDDFWLRLTAAILCLFLVLKDWWPKQLARFYYPYSYAVLIYTLPFALVFMALKNGGGVAGVGNMMLAVFFLILIADWRNMLVMLGLGFGAAVLAYVTTDSNPVIPMDYLARLPLMVLVVIGGSLFKGLAEGIVEQQVRQASMNQAYAALAGSIAHEMRNPLGQFKSSLSLMIDALPAPTLASQDQMLRAVRVDQLYRQVALSEVAVRRGLQVIAMTLDQVNDKPLDTARFSCLGAAETCAKAVQEFGYETDESRGKVVLKHEADFNFRGDETAFLFVLFNLLKNALYYTSAYPDSLITVTVQDHMVRVRDTGPGIPAHSLARLFEPFRSEGKAGGTGLGLPYCSRVMHAFGGAITCDSRLGEYTEFVMTFPRVALQDAQSHRLSILEQAGARFAGKRLLIVDDDAALRLTTMHKLRSLGAQMDEAPDGERALQMLEAQNYDLVLLDLRMPGLDGYAVAGHIRAGHSPSLRNICIVAHSSEPAHLAAVKARKAGMDGFVAKPCEQLPLVQALLHAMDNPVAADQHNNAALAGLRVVLADDSDVNRAAVTAYLASAGIEVAGVSSGQAVLELMARQGRWDAVLLDINMPGFDGLQTARAIRAGGPSHCAVPILALTGHSDEFMRTQALESGMNGYIVKPVEPTHLLSELRSACGLTPAAASTQAASRQAGSDGELLDHARLQYFEEMGILEKLVADYRPQLSRQASELARSVNARNLDASLDTLHLMVGMSGEMGMSALHGFARTVYQAMTEGRCWPEEQGWLNRIQSLARDTDSALDSLCP